MKVFAISGSLRRASFNTAALRAAKALAPEGVEVTIYEGLRDIPPYDDEVRTGSGYPAPVAALRAAIKEADALLFASPEYNFSISGVLKNAIDWASRVPDQPFDGKPVAILGAATGLYGTARSQYDLRKILASLNAQLLNKPEVLIAQAASKFDAAGNLTDETVRGLIAQQMVALRDWTLRLKG
ncbi:NADPH-dependent FMN reductase [Falsiroseomonas oryzae]|uniref:NADPH-dependent FMN reductase n=1 Tax=Falsiroseomonas oryzae TaxID=2766473 RepID=UPI0022EAAB01|nr:NAD(P)H-dependent oxidoreductase [Roseomonas sp. MO-31]